MKIILTKHCRQRRPHYEITPADFLIKWVEFFIEKLSLDDMNNDVYKIYSGGNTAVIRKDDDKLILITFRGFKHFDNKERYNIKYSKQSERVFLKDVNGKTKTIGQIEQNGEQVTIKFRNGFISNYDIEGLFKTTTFENIEKLNEFFSLSNEKWILKPFARKEGQENIYRINFKGRLVVCGKLNDNIIQLHNGLLRKFDIPIESYTNTPSDNKNFIHRNEERNIWVLNDFPRLIQV